ncbi:TPA: baseplate J/gp47 family protein [Yersinia enterocolitica]|nr:baseplate J/gp47 family protein [Yersinia enterocolitica]HDL6691546.1 baseplate J/gp47 family protein [Yersinia enterocolitica]HDL8292232.1 baseplate J/gp47 family protein [Yersinia enterocolitica]HEN3238812.1 baseplate J/gp47 family protein [Yersinia enterocolitica]HEN3316479.1 baseplate J/gp47 family protein [Yersinia enterocolitica]
MNNKPEIDYEQVLKDSGMPTTETDIRQKFDELVEEEGLITNTSDMSPFWRLIKTIVTRPVLWLNEVLINTVLANMYLATASGTFLEVFGWGVNARRKPATAAQGMIRFYKTDIQQDVVIPAGTLIQTERINSKIYSVEVSVETMIAAGAASGLVPVKAADVGGAFNLAPGYYRILPQAVPGIERAQSEGDWLTVPGADKESDDDFRDRCRNQFNLVGNYHTDAVYRSMIAGVVGLSIDRIYFLHDAPRGPGTANAYLLLDSGEISQPFIDAVNDHITAQGHHGHGDDMQCMPLPESQHDLVVTLYVSNKQNLTADELAGLESGCENLIRCAFRQNSTYKVLKTWPYSRFSFSNLGRELHKTFPLIESLSFSLMDIVSGLSVPRLNSLTVVIENA